MDIIALSISLFSVSCILMLIVYHVTNGLDAARRVKKELQNVCWDLFVDSVVNSPEAQMYIQLCDGVPKQRRYFGVLNE